MSRDVSRDSVIHAFELHIICMNIYLAMKVNS